MVRPHDALTHLAADNTPPQGATAQDEVNALAVVHFTGVCDGVPPGEGALYVRVEAPEHVQQSERGVAVGRRRVGLGTRMGGGLGTSAQLGLYELQKVLPGGRV